MKEAEVEQCTAVIALGIPSVWVSFTRGASCAASRVPVAMETLHRGVDVQRPRACVVELSGCQQLQPTRRRWVSALVG